MIITYIRSSSISSYNWCPHKFYISSNLGIKEGSGKAADLGNIVHKALELLARKKLADQLGQPTFFDEELNSSFNSDGFTADMAIQLGWDNYTNPAKTPHNWMPADFKQVKKLTNDVLLYNNGMFNPLKREIVMPEQYFDIEMTEPWARYQYKHPNKPGEYIEGNLRIKGTMDLITRATPTMIEYVDWKGLPLDTPIPTTNGWTTMGDIQVGDITFDKDGLQTKVIGKSKASYKKCYRITFDDKTNVVCDEDHLWTLNDDSVKKITDLKVKDKISVTKFLQIEDVKLPIDPYVLGVWLGDGRNRGGEICSMEDFIFDEIRERGYKVGEDISNDEENQSESRTVYGLTTELRKLNLIHNKHIPMIYLRASHNQRMDLLRGLMDTDGNVNECRKQCVFTNCNKRLSDDTKALLTTLGQRVNQADVTRNTNFKDGVKVYPLAFRPIGINPFLLPRKKNNVGNWGPGDSNRRLVKKIELLNTLIETQCIMVDSPTNTYLCTKDMIPTHNTGKRIDWETDKEKGYEDLRKDFQMRLYHYALCKLYPNDDVLMTIYFIKSGGAFTLLLERSDLPKTESIIRTHFEAIKRDNRPRRIRDFNPNSWKCSRLCKFFKEIDKESGKNLCDFYRDKIYQIGIEKVTAKHRIEESPWGAYGSGGGVSNRDGEKK